MMTLTLCFDSNGVGYSLYTEIIDLHSLGQLEIHRATTIEFNNNRADLGGKGQ